MWLLRLPAVLAAPTCCSCAWTAWVGLTWAEVLAVAMPSLTVRVTVRAPAEP